MPRARAECPIQYRPMREQTLLWTVPCIICGAQSGETCCSLVTGRELEEGHTLRIWKQREWDETHTSHGQDREPVDRR
jgi:hypothetical protein